jgi:putative FmdB family regulatory protein
MPIYEYQCKACGQHFEEIQRINDEPYRFHHSACGLVRDKLITRDYCGEVERLISATSFQLKGKGWFRDGY